ncbi:MAG: beta-phosphoglucomutase [Cyclobacteriaceae bacterium]|nr:beta-phosphoglucomutase [Cyclobacteriaceae bacterium]
MITTCIFDLDGVIVDTAKFHYLAWQRLAKELGITFTETDNERLKGVSRMESLDILLSLGTRTYDARAKEEMAARKNAWFVDYINAMKPEDIFPGVRELLVELRKKGYRLGLASSSKNAGTVLDRVGIASLFDAVVDGNMIKNSKPDPEVFLLAASKLKAKPSECVVFEDAEAGVEAAIRAGMKSVGIGSPKQLGKANQVVARTGDFKAEWLDKL